MTAVTRPTIPSFATHYHRADREPFLNLSDLPDGAVPSVLAGLEASRGADSRRVFGRRYMELRRLTERRMRELFVATGGAPQRLAPHYFVLGTSEWYRGLAPGMREVRVDLARLPAESTSFTYPDSFTAMGFATRFGLPYEARPYHERVFRMDELQGVVDRFGLPADDIDPVYDGYAHRPFEKYVEIQLWSDAPLDLIGRGSEDAGSEHRR